MPTTANSYVADAIVKHLASGTWPSDEDAAPLLYAREIPQLRLLVRGMPEVISACLEVASNETGPRAKFALALLRHVSGEHEIAARFRDLFLEHADSNPVFACHLIWRVLDDENLPYEWHQRLFQYILGHWNDWKLHIAEFKEPGPE